jgi:TolA-binding protein
MPDPIPRIGSAVLAEAERVAASATLRPSEADARGEVRIAGIAERGPTFLDRLRGALFKPAFATALAASVVFAISFYLYRNAAPDYDEDVGAQGAPFYGPAGAPNSEPIAAAESAAILARADGARAVDERIGGEGAQPSRPSLGTARSVAQSKGSMGTAGPAQVNSADELDRAEAESGKLAAEAPVRADEPSWGQAGGGFASGDKASGAAKASPAPVDNGSAEAFAEGMNAYDRGDCAAATTSLERVVDSYGAPMGLVPKALHHLARCARRSGSCGRAVVYYERLFNEYHSYEQRPEAMWEAAACHRRLGHVEQSLALLRQLAQLPGWGAKADSEIDNIESLAADQ